MNKKQTTIQSPDWKAVLDAVSMLKLLSSPHRLAILCLLERRERSVSELAEHVDLSQSALSQHLAKLREQKLVATRREQQTIYYRMNSPQAGAIIQTLHNIYCQPRKGDGS